MRGQLTSAVATMLACVACSARAQEIDQSIIVTAPGAGVDSDDALGLSRGDIARGGRPDLIGALTRQLPGVTLQDAQGNPWQPALVYRGQTASGAQGQSQGLAAYLDGARFNLPFGDTISLDLVPDVALRTVELVDSSPVYGLNALGGALVLETATGRSEPGLSANASLGAYGAHDVSLAAGGAAGRWSAYAAVQLRGEDGWRDYSTSRLASGYADLGYDGVAAGLHAKLVLASTGLSGNGAAPEELLAVRRSAVFTHPDRTENRFARLSLHPWADLSPTTRLQAAFYAQWLKSRLLNGDAADIEPCEDDTGLLCLETENEGEEEAEVLTDRQGRPIRALAGDPTYAVFNHGALSSRAFGLLAQITDRRPLLGGSNVFTIGTSLDYGRSAFGATTELGTLDDTRGVQSVGPVIAQDDNAIAPVSVIARNLYAGFFVAETLPLGPNLHLEAGLRYNYAAIRLDDQIGTALNGQHHFGRLNPGLELDWDAVPGLSLRAGYAETNRAPTPAELSCADPEAPCSLANFFVADPPLRQVVAHTWELGASGKGTAGGWRIEWLASAYRADSRDEIRRVASGVRGRAYFQNLGDARRQGIELSLTAQRGGLRVAATYAFTDATNRSPVRIASPGNPAAEAGAILVQPGDRLPGVPRHSANLNLDYAGKVGPWRRFTVGGTVSARSGQVLLGDESNRAALVPGYVLVDLRAGIELLREVVLFGEVRNLLDRRHATFGTFGEIGSVLLAEAPGASSPRFLGPGAPRRWTIGIRRGF
ncbi:TonB-dependent receptor [Novosphingobium sp. AAP93]|uniref:TonB-dependent receptor n=1 Tax=Novosphingobium sp. AAP93 TaxID=1523427 RepID=UPI0006B952EE|nr:TonB-dependent receptor [Novosphingobium sp. AAP93]KPF87817.1 TonB-dependent receptor [Novosphingobium sp. AAP93]